MKRKHWGWLLILVLLQGCGGSTGPTEKSARSKITAELDKWLAGTESEATTFEASLNQYKAPISYSIRTVVPTEPKAPIEFLAKNPDATYDQDAPAFRVVVDVDFKSRAGTEVKKVVEFNLTWVEQLGDWVIEEEL